jgi:hypothetical protein
LKYQPAKKIIFVFLVLTLVSSVSTITFVTGNNNVNLAFAKKHTGSNSSSGGSGGSSDNSDSSAQPLTHAPDNSDNSQAATIDNTPTSPKTCSDGSSPASDGSCPTQTASLAQTVDCNATPNDPSCTSTSFTTTTKPLSPAEQNFAPQGITQQRCPLLPMDANGNCQRVDMQGGGVGLPPLLGSQEKQQAHYNLPYDVIRVKQLPDGSCPADYHYNTNASDANYCLINIHLKNPDGSCPVGTIMTTNNVCVKMPVLPGTSTGSGGGFIQMFPTSPPTSPPATSPTNTTPYLPPPSTK